MNELDKSRHTGRFRISQDREVTGNLSLDGLDSSLYLWDKEFFAPESSHEVLTGVLDNLTKVSLIDFIWSGPGSHSRQGDITHFSNIYPNFVVFGEEYVSDVDEKIIESCFLLDDATDIFYDAGTFGLVRDPHPVMKQIIDSKNSYHDVIMGKYPKVAYYTGKSEIFSSDTELGKISASHAISYNLGGPGGIRIDNKIYIKMKFGVAITFREVIDRLWKVIRFFALIVGRSPNLLEFKIFTGTGQNHEPLRVYDSRLPKYQRLDNEYNPYPGGILMDAVHDPDGFSGVLKAWLERENALANARGSFFQFFEKQQLYDIPRLINAANMFDIMPKEVFNEPEELSSKLIDAKKEAEKMFNKLPYSADRDSVLSALGRIGKLTLKRKIRSRVFLLSEKIGDRLPELLLVTDEAVKCRNYYVHGVNSPINYDKESWMLVFFTQSLEFVFTATDLIEAGWDIKAWCENENHKTHPFGYFIKYSYSSDLIKLKSLLPTSRC